MSSAHRRQAPGRHSRLGSKPPSWTSAVPSEGNATADWGYERPRPIESSLTPGAGTPARIYAIVSARTQRTSRSLPDPLILMAGIAGFVGGLRHREIVFDGGAMVTGASSPPLKG